MDLIKNFTLEKTNFVGKFIRLEQTINDSIKLSSYPNPVKNLLAELQLVCGLLGTSLKFDGALSITINADNLLNFATVDYFNDGQIRAYAQIKENAVIEDNATFIDLIGEGRIVITLDHGKNMGSYQGIIAIEDEKNLSQCVEKYFAQSEQIPTYIKLSVADKYVDRKSVKCGGGIIIQNILQQDDGRDLWSEVGVLINTLTHSELVDSMEPMDQVLYSLFHEIGVRVYNEKHISHGCKCSRAKFLKAINNFSITDRREMLVEDKIIVNCHFCNKQEVFTLSDIELDRPN